MNPVIKYRSFMPVPGNISYIMLFLQLFYFVLFIFYKIPGYSIAVSGILSMLYGIITLTLLSSVFELILCKPILRRIFVPFLILLLWTVNAYQLETGSSMDFALVMDNIGISFSAEAFTMISSPFSTGDTVILIVFLITILSLEFRFSLSKWPGKINLRSGIFSLFSWILLVIIPVQSGDGFTLFAKSAISINNTPVYARAVTSDYPYQKNSIALTHLNSSAPSEKKIKPNVFLILIESFNANFIETRAADGIEYTPNFNSLINKGLYLDRFYGNSIQTCKGQAAIFYSILPSIKGKIFVDYPDINIGGFPSILADAGYQTVFFQAFHNLKFDNTKNNMVKAGFSIVKSYAEFRRKEDKPDIWGWGVEDKIFYERFFEMLDKLHAQSPEKPVFASLMTIGTHIPCDGMPPEKRTIYKDPQNIKEKYSNALRLSDSQLPRFFQLLRERKYLENSIIILTSDHSFPMKEHGVYNNEICFYDEAFRIPFLVIWDGIIKPERIKDRAYSQLDIGPTITDMLGISKAAHNMTGISMFDRNSIHPVYLIQPYNGRFLQVLNYPYKYITHLKTGKEYLFDLEKDPGEKNNLIMQNDYIKTVTGMKESINAIYLNQQLLDENRIRKK